MADFLVGKLSLLANLGTEFNATMVFLYLINLINIEMVSPRDC